MPQISPILHNRLLHSKKDCCKLKTLVYDANTVRKYCHFFIYECFYMKLTVSLFSTTISHLVFITFITYYLLIDNNARRCLCRVGLRLHRLCTHYLLVSSCSYLVINVTKRQLHSFKEGELPQMNLKYCR